ncbi:MAG: putative transposase [Rhodospirillales bacterium]|nr:putative transposase [Rhodospirillales bacterium]
MVRMDPERFRTVKTLVVEVDFDTDPNSPEFRGNVLGYDDAMQPVSYAGHRFPVDLIRHAVWLYLRFTLRYRDTDDLLAP